ncbi:1-acyl-sn-glycerol-3-phosphate acyltransferase [Candidatus Falkowbacteria bacterium]|jgi:1-acyl-sn-glycerol-3-phosphate acyltransferase|nr:1-acyl-sn-glycerol-3-phosphate acyltransferase [Candidatus Falkowbacteria bacterium]MBT4433180.1 1-acyl-sn-glycerol-3-phosphate acyltransferase [Candidatus Falkowbacteria bacterium]
MIYFFQKLVWIPLVILFKIFLKFEVKGQENFKLIKNKQYFIVANHLGYLDAFLVSGSIPFFRFLKVNLRYMITPKWFKRYPFVKFLGAYPVYRKQESLEKTLVKTEELIKKGKHMLIFPEGTFRKSEEGPKPRQGIAYLSKKYNLPIIPIALRGSDGTNGDNRFDIKRFFSSKSQVKVKIGEPFYYQDVAEEGMDNFMVAEKIMQRVREML